MKVVFILQEDVLNKNSWSGTPYYIYSALKRKIPELELFAPLKLSLSNKFRKKILKIINQLLVRFFNVSYLHSDIPIFILRNWSKQVDKYLKTHKNYLVISTSIYPFVYTKSDFKMVQITDATPILLIRDYQKMAYSKKLIKMKEKFSLKVTSKANLIVAASEWCRHSAIYDYNMGVKKVITIPFGANFENDEIIYKEKSINKKDQINFLFVGKEWQRKGLDIAVNVLDLLYKDDYKISFTVVGCNVPDSLNRNYITNILYLDKNQSNDREKLIKLFDTSHFYIMPSRAEAYGIVFAEAAGFGLPVIATNVGGIPTIVEDNKTGILMELNEDIDNWKNRIIELIEDKNKYAEISKKSRLKYENVLNWEIFTDKLLFELKKRVL